MRVVNEGITFVGEIHLNEDTDLNRKIIAYALKNLRFAGAKRNRGCGQIECNIIPEDGKVQHRPSPVQIIKKPVTPIVAQTKQEAKQSAQNKYKNKQAFQGKPKHKAKKKRR